MKRTAEEYKNVMESVMAMKIATAASEPVYHASRWTDESTAEAMNEAYIAGLREALRTIKASGFLVEQEVDYGP